MENKNGSLFPGTGIVNADLLAKQYYDPAIHNDKDALERKSDPQT